MIVYALECTGNIAVAINGKPRTNFEKGDVVIVGRDEYLSLIRLGFILVEEIELNYADISKKTKKTKKTSDENTQKTENAQNTSK